MNVIDQLQAVTTMQDRLTTLYKKAVKLRRRLGKTPPDETLESDVEALEIEMYEICQRVESLN